MHNVLRSHSNLNASAEDTIHLGAVAAIVLPCCPGEGEHLEGRECATLELARKPMGMPGAHRATAQITNRRLLEPMGVLIVEAFLASQLHVELVTVANVLLASPHPGPYPRAVGPVLSSKGLDRAC